jgi:DNA-binding protein HU-beta
MLGVSPDGNPATGEPIQIKATKRVAFRAAKDLKEII